MKTEQNGVRSVKSEAELAVDVTEAKDRDKASHGLFATTELLVIFPPHLKHVCLHYLAERLLRTHSTFSKLLMTFVCVFKLRKKNLTFVDPGVEINDTYTAVTCC